MVDHFRFSSGRGIERFWSRKGRSGRFFALGLALLLFLLSAVVHVTHTCAPYRLAPPDPPAQGISRDARPAAGHQDPDDSPCLACLLLHALNATQIALLNFDLSKLSDFQHISPLPSPLLTRDEACLCLIRAPPRSALPS